MEDSREATFREIQKIVDSKGVKAGNTIQEFKYKNCGCRIYIYQHLGLIVFHLWKLPLDFVHVEQTFCAIFMLMYSE